MNCCVTSTRYDFYVLPARVFLIDTYGFIFRAYHARARSGAPPMRTSKGISTEAIFIFTNMVRKLAKEQKPDYIAAIFESAGKTLREQEFAEYKANRTEMPQDLGEQIPYIRRMLEAMRIPILSFPGFEADDVIGTIARRVAETGDEVVIVSSDKDMLQLVNDRVTMYNPAKDDTWYNAEKVKEFMGVRPEQVADLLALKGDAVDNIPGAPGIGDKGAKDLIEQFGSVEQALERAGEVTRKMYRESLQQNRERVLLSKRLATIECAVPIEFTKEAMAAVEPDVGALRALFKELEFHTHLKELGPAEDLRTRDLGVLSSAPEVEAYLEAHRGSSLTGVALRGDQVGIAPSENEARGMPRALLGQLQGWLEDDSAVKAGCEIKTDLLAMRQAGLTPRGFREDCALYAFLLDAEPSGCSLEQLAQRKLDIKLSPDVAQHALYARELCGMLGQAVNERGLRELYETIDLPLASVLATMEQTGILVDRVELGRLSELMDVEISRLTAEIHTLAECEFNIASPQQVGRVLFEQMKLPQPVKYGRGKTVSTAADVLEELAEQHEIARKVLEYRGLTKLKGTYVDALPALIDAQTGRIHTSFNQMGAATGRLSSSNPNLQNIPIKTELGREIRAAFVPRPGWKLLVADYSQIELRLLAHMSKDPVLVEAFRTGEDIHTRTAAEVMGVPPMLVTREARNRAKAVNFGIVYGISSFGLAQQLGISRKEAEQYIQGYFARYSGVRRFIDQTIEQVRVTGVTKTLFGRERPIPDMNSRNPNARGFAERTAVNSPLQGTAADLIKLAMIRIDKELERFRAKLLLQVHDELVLEAPEEEAEEIGAIVKREMEGAFALEVPLVAEVGTGLNWRDAK
jgi:DNA polymerase-1